MVEVCTMVVVGEVALVRLVDDDEGMDVTEDEIEDVLEELVIGTDEELETEEKLVELVVELLLTPNERAAAPAIIIMTMTATTTTNLEIA